MSVVNQMLNDLEQRRRKTSSPSRDVMSGLKAVTQAALPVNRFHWLFIPIALLVVGVSCYQLAIMGAKKKLIKAMVPSAIQVAHPVHIAPLKPQKIPIVVSKPAIVHSASLLSQISWREDGEGHVVGEFSLDQPIHYRLVTHPDGQFAIWLNDTHYVYAHLPSLGDVGLTALESVKLQKHDGDLGVILSLKTGTQLQAIHFDKQHKTLKIVLKPAVAKKAAEPKVVIHRQTITPADAHYQAFVESFSNRTPRENIAQLQKLIAKYPTLKPAWQSLATILLQQGQTRSASQVVLAALQHWPSDLSFYTLQARSLVMAGRSEEALHVLSSITPNVETHPDYYAFLAGLHEQLGHHEIAQQLYQQVLVVEPDQGKWWAGLAMAYEKKQQFNAAKLAYEHALAAQGLTPTLRALIGVKLSHLKS